MPIAKKNPDRLDSARSESAHGAACFAPAHHARLKPKVSFIVPCYRFGEFLGECLNSILAQTFEDFEILLMDDCSPDNTPEVAASFNDPRIRYVRNEHNVGHLQNYNKGIGLALGEYIWLISADDRLRAPYVLARYVCLMEENPRVGYVFCPGLRLENGHEKEVVDWAALERPDSIFDGRKFLYWLLMKNCILAPAVLARAECYRTIGPFPLDMPYAGDWYLWCAFALHYDVAYLAEPMVNYRLHSRSMTCILRDKDSSILSRDLLALCLRIRERVSAVGDRSLQRHCDREFYRRYFHHIVSSRVNRHELELYLHNLASDSRKRESIERKATGRAIFQLFLKQEFQHAREAYEFAVLHKRWTGPVLWIDHVLLKLGRNGIPLARAARLLKRQVVGLVGL
jgi:glycosyltransferase involved in cell wall biosynthesis